MSLARSRARLALTGLALGLTAALTIGATVDAAAKPRSADRTPSTAAARVGITASGGGFAGWAVQAKRLAHPGQAVPQLSPQPQASSTVEGIDVSSYQGDVDWPAWWSKGIRFAYVKATEGTSYTNPYFSGQYTGSANVGMIRGAYHFARPDSSSGAAQAKYFVAHGGGWTADGRTLPGALDVEQNYTDSSHPCYGKSPAQMLAWIESFTGEYWSLLHRHVPIYTNASFWKTCVGNSTHYKSTNPLWFAYYGTSLPALPGGWSYETIWQYSGSGAADRDRFSSSLTQLKKLAVTKYS